MTAVVPIKRFNAAKQRLADAFTPEFRSSLAAIMLRDVLATLAAAPSLCRIAVVTLDAEAGRIAKYFGARLMTEAADDGYTEAATAAVGTLAREGAAGVLIVPGDIPGVEVSDIEILLRAHAVAPAFSIVPARDGGSNAVMCSPPDIVPLGFGKRSSRVHLARARAAGLTPSIIAIPRIALDIDTLEDVQAFVKAGFSCNTQRFLERHGLSAQLSRACS